MTEEELSRLAPLCSDFVAIEDSIIFTEGRNALHLYLVTKGKVGLQKSIRPPHGRHSRRTTVALCFPGEAFGWAALVEPYKYTHSAVAWESCRLISIDAKLMRRVLDMYPEMGFRVMKSLTVVIVDRQR